MKAVVDEQSQENAWLKTELAKKENGMKELQTQLGMVKMEALKCKPNSFKSGKKSWRKQISRSLN